MLLSLTKWQDKTEGYIGPVAPLAASLQRAKNASIEQAVSGLLFSSGASGETRRFARGIRAPTEAVAAAAAAATAAVASQDPSTPAAALDGTVSSDPGGPGPAIGRAVHQRRGETPASRNSSNSWVRALEALCSVRVSHGTATKRIRGSAPFVRPSYAQNMRLRFSWSG